MRKGLRMIGGQEYMLCGRTFGKFDAVDQARELRKSWARVRVIKVSNWDYMLYVHGAK